MKVKDNKGDRAKNQDRTRAIAKRAKRAKYQTGKIQKDWVDKKEQKGAKRDFRDRHKM